MDRIYFDVPMTNVSDEVAQHEEMETVIVTEDMKVHFAMPVTNEVEEVVQQGGREDGRGEAVEFSDESHYMRTFWSSPVDRKDARDMTELLLSIVTSDDFSQKFKSPHKTKKRTWEEVAARFATLGYPLPGENLSEQGLRVSCKWHNLRKMMHQHLKRIHRNEGRRSLATPRYYNQVFEVMKGTTRRTRGPGNKRKLLKAARVSAVASSFKSLGTTANVQTRHSSQPTTSIPIRRSARSLPICINVPPLAPLSSSNHTDSSPVIPIASPNHSSSPSGNLYNNINQSQESENKVALILEYMRESDLQAEERHKAKMQKLDKHFEIMEKLMQEEISLKRELVSLLKRRSQSSDDE